MTKDEAVEKLPPVKIKPIRSFKESVYELAFGYDAINKDYTDQEVLDKLFGDLQLLQKYIEEFGDYALPNRGW